MKVVVATPSLADLTAPYLHSLAASVPALEAASHQTSFIREIGSPYISSARATMLRKALDSDAEAVVFIDYDLSWDASNLVKLIETEGDVVAGTYRFKKPEVEYMGSWICHADGRPKVRDADGAIAADRVPAGFLKVTRAAVRKFMRAYPELLYGDPERPSIDLFNHGAWDGVWWGEDYAFSRRWRQCGDIWLVPDLNLNHHGTDGTDYPGNLHEWLMRLPGGSKHEVKNEQT
jgi:hypothetical protein